MGDRVAIGRTARKALAVTAAIGCSPASVRTQGPEATAAEYLEAVRRGDANAARDRVHPEAVERFSWPATAPASGPTTPPVRVVTQGALEFICTSRAPESCRLRTSLPRFDGRDSPDAALALLERALKRRDREHLRLLAPAGVRARLTDESFDRREEAGWQVAEEAVAALKSDGRWVPEGDRYTRRVSLGHEASFALEPEGWVLVDLR